MDDYQFSLQAADTLEQLLVFRAISTHEGGSHCSRGMIDCPVGEDANGV